MTSSSPAARSSSSPAFPAQRRVGRYVLFDEFARGGMASVHFGRLVGAAGFSRVVAIKRVRSAFSDSEDFQRAIIREARLASRIRHPNVVQTLDVVIDDGITHVVMEYVHGATIAELARKAKGRSERVPTGIAVGVVIDALQGLQAAHEARNPEGKPLGIVHRDVSPQNVHVGVDGHARLLDFGIASAIDRTQVTEAGVVKGKIAYMAREQLRGAPVTRQVDVYGAGVVLWEMLTGERLFDDADVGALTTRVLTESIPPPSARVPALSRELDQIVLRATAADPRHRFETAAEMLSALTLLDAAADPLTISAWVERLTGDDLELRAESLKRVETASVDERSLPDPSDDEHHARAWRMAVGVALSVGAIVFLSVIALQPRRAIPGETSVSVGSTVPVVAPAASPPLTTETVAEPPLYEIDTPPTPPKAPTSPTRAKAARHRTMIACDPPFSIDAHGTKIYKEECLR